MESETPVNIISTGRPAIFVHEDKKVPGLAVVAYQGTATYESVLLSDIEQTEKLLPESNWMPLRKGDRVWLERRIVGHQKKKVFGVVEGPHHRVGSEGPLRVFVHWENDDGKTPESVFPGEVHYQAEDLKVGDFVSVRLIATPGRVLELGEVETLVETLDGRRILFKTEYLVRLSASAISTVKLLDADAGLGM